MVHFYRFPSLDWYKCNSTRKRHAETIPPSPDIVSDKKNEEKERKKMVKRKPYKHILTTEKTFISIKAISLTF